MKGIKTILGAFAFASMLFVSFNANAQENNNRDENGKVVRGAYETGRFGDNWFIGLGAGVNSYFDNGDFGKFGLAIDANVGKWFTPSVGARIGYRGLSDKVENPTNFAPGADKWNFHSIHGDVMWNLSNALGGYKETRFWDLIPYATFSSLFHRYPVGGETITNWEYGAGLGLLNDFRLGKHVDLFIDLSALVLREAGLRTPANDRYALLPTATAGLIFNLGKSSFDRHSSITPVVIPVPFTLDQYNALKDKVAALEKENAELKDRIAALEAENAKYKNLKDGCTYLYKDGEFIETVNTITTPATLYFDLDKATLTARELAHLEFYAQNALNEDSEVTLVGSADHNTGTSPYNQKLSEKRANYVKDLLVDKYGLNADNITIDAQGDTNNVFDTPAKNRVVTIRVK